MKHDILNVFVWSLGIVKIYEMGMTLWIKVFKRMSAGEGKA